MSSSITGIPTGYREVRYWKVSDKASRLVAVQLLAIPLFFVTGGLFFGLALAVGRLPLQFTIGLGEFVLMLAALAATLFVHELAHGLTMQALGAQPSYGVMIDKLLFYATAPGHVFGRAAYIAVTVAPLLALSVLAVLGMFPLSGTAWVGLLALCATVNASGAIGDLWILTVVLRYPAYALIMDERDGLRVFLPAR